MCYYDIVSKYGKADWWLL